MHEDVGSHNLDEQVLKLFKLIYAANLDKMWNQHCAFFWHTPLLLLCPRAPSSRKPHSPPNNFVLGAFTYYVRILFSFFDRPTVSTFSTYLHSRIHSTSLTYIRFLGPPPLPLLWKSYLEAPCVEETRKRGREGYHSTALTD